LTSNSRFGEVGFWGLTIPITLQKSPFVLPCSDADTATAVCTTAPPVGKPIADAGIENPWRPAHADAGSGVVASWASAVNATLARDPVRRM
jgi:hypothetical protein